MDSFLINEDIRGDPLGMAMVNFQLDEMQEMLKELAHQFAGGNSTTCGTLGY